MSSSIVLSAATRQSLLAAQDTASLLTQTQNRLSSGKKVSSALDNPTNFYQASSINSRASDLAGLLDSISNGVQTIQAANTGLTNIQKLIDTAKSTANQAIATTVTTSGKATSAATTGTAGATANITVAIGNGATSALTVTVGTDIATANANLISALNTAFGQNAVSLAADGKLSVAGTGVLKIIGGPFATAGSDSTSTTYIDESSYSADLSYSGLSARSSLASQYNDLLTQIDQLASDSSYNGKNLINSSAASNTLAIQFNETNSSNVTVKGVDATRTGLGLSAITLDKANSFLFDSDVTSVVTNLTSATTKLRGYSSTLGGNLTVVQNRQDFIKNLNNVLTTGADKLTNADLNEEAANSQALSTRQSLAISALSLANTAQQNVLQLLR